MSPATRSKNEFRFNRPVTGSRSRCTVSSANSLMNIRHANTANRLTITMSSTVATAVDGSTWATRIER